VRALIVHAHHEPKSFCSALFHQAVQTLSEAGYEVVTSDLYSERFDPISDRRNFSSVFDAEYLKQLTTEGKVALVTGSSSGIGASIAQTSAREGATVIVHGRNI
jgi:NAD(P)H dehydrogenase (quinone)